MSSPIGGFMPIPLAMMMPFMAAQSMLMGDAFGKGFQFGKRKISAMSNEEFNSLTMSNMVTDMQTEFKNIVPTIQQSIIESRQVQNVIIEEMIKIVPEFLKFLTLQGISQVTKSADEIAHTIGTHVGHETTQDQPGTTAVPTITSRRTSTTLKLPTTPNKTTRHTHSTAERNKILLNLDGTITSLIRAIVDYIPKINARDSNENVTKFKNGKFPFPDHLVLRKMYLEYIRQTQYRVNILAGVVQY